MGTLADVRELVEERISLMIKELKVRLKDRIIASKKEKAIV